MNAKQGKYKPDYLIGGFVLPRYISFMTELYRKEWSKQRYILPPKMARNRKGGGYPVW